MEQKVKKWTNTQVLAQADNLLKPQLCQELEPLFPANLVYAQGVIARGIGDWERLQSYSKALERNPAYPICLNTYGLLRDIGRTHQSGIGTSPEVNPNFGAVRTIGLCAQGCGSLRSISGYAEQALSDNPAAHLMSYSP